MGTLLENLHLLYPASIIFNGLVTLVVLDHCGQLGRARVE